MRCLAVVAHPLADSLCRHLADVAVAALRRGGHDVTLLDLYAADFDPRLSAAERRSYHQPEYDGAAVAEQTTLLAEAEALVLVFPTWWFGPPAILKGFIDRTFAPGVAFEHGDNGGPIRPLLTRLRHAAAITTLGSPWWAEIALGMPVKRVLKRGVIGACAPRARFDYLALHSVETVSAAQVKTVRGAHRAHAGALRRVAARPPRRNKRSACAIQSPDLSRRHDMMKQLVLAAAAASTLAMTPLAAHAQQPKRVEFGNLECTIEGGIGLIVTSSKKMTCTFTPAHNGAPTDFYGVVRKYGLDLGVTGKTVMEWVVLAPVDASYTAAALSGTYVGASAEVSAAIGGGANLLVGGDGNSFVLQPLSVQAQTGVNVAVGVTRFELHALN